MPQGWTKDIRLGTAIQGKKYNVGKASQLSRLLKVATRCTRLDQIHLSCRASLPIRAALLVQERVNSVPSHPPPPLVSLCQRFSNNVWRTCGCFGGLSEAGETWT